MSYNIPYNLLLDTNSPELRAIIKDLQKDFKLKQNTSFNALKSVLCNLYKAKDRHVMAGRKRETLGDQITNPLRIGYDARNTAVDRLIEVGYINQDLGDKLEGKMTTIVATEKLKDWFIDNGWSDDKIDKATTSYVTVRKATKKGEGKQYLDYMDTKYSLWLKEKMKAYNELLSSQKIEVVIDGETHPYEDFHLSRPFIRHDTDEIELDENEDFMFGGRIYGPWAYPNGEVRKTITINGEETIELDRDASHLNTMYQVITGSPYQGKDDAYKIFIGRTEIPRFIVKKYAAFMQGSEPDYRSTAIRVAKDFRRQAEKKDATQKDIDNFELFKEWKKDYSAKQIIDAYLAKHPKISSYYRRGKLWGDYISCWESDILFEILIDLTDRGIAALSIYDSVIVQKKHQDYVESIINTKPYVDRKDLLRYLT